MNESRKWFEGQGEVFERRLLRGRALMSVALPGAQNPSHKSSAFVRRPGVSRISADHRETACRRPVCPDAVCYVYDDLNRRTQAKRPDYSHVLQADRHEPCPKLS